MHYEGSLEEYQGGLRPVIESVEPSVDNGENPVKRIVGEPVDVSAVVYSDGHDKISVSLKHRKWDSDQWYVIPMEPDFNDVWRAGFLIAEEGLHYYTISARVDHFLTWRDAISKKKEAGVVTETDLQIGVKIVEEALNRARGKEADRLRLHLRVLRGENGMPPIEERIDRALDFELNEIMKRHPDHSRDAECESPYPLIVERERAAFSAWYEIFPRSMAGEPGRHGTFHDVIRMLPRIAGMGFDVLYFPPIHPIGTTFRKGKNNALEAMEGEPGSPWAIGSSEGGFKAIHSELGTLEEFRELVKHAKEKGLEIALDLAYQCSPDHPYVSEHPEWFKKRPDGTIQYAENPPKKYQDIYPFNFETEEWKELWTELKSVVEYWAENGVKIFRVDNPHTKSFRFWRWMISDIKRKYPDVIFLSEAFTRPSVMYHLGKIGFSQSYTYFTWRNTKQEFIDYINELAHSEIAEFFRPNFWPNTPDILPDHLVKGGRPAFMARLVLAATLSSNYGIYGFPFEQIEHKPLTEGSEEYLNSEKYEIRVWNPDKSGNLSHFISMINFIRRDNPALWQNRNIAFIHIDNDNLLCYAKYTSDRRNRILICVNLDYTWSQSGWIDFELEYFGIDPSRPYRLIDLIGGNSYEWFGGHNYIELDPAGIPAHVFRIEQDVPDGESDDN